MLLLLCLFLVSDLSSALTKQRTRFRDPLIDALAQELTVRKNLETQVRQLQDTVQNLQNEVKTTTGSPIVAFEGKLSANLHGIQDEVVTFDTIITDIGHAYNTSTGVFRCPVKGLYLFSLTVLVDGTKGKRLHGFTMFQNSKVIARPIAGPAASFVGTGETAVVEANAGDTIVVRKYGYPNSPDVKYDNFSRFSGVLLHAM